MDPRDPNDRAGGECDGAQLQGNDRVDCRRQRVVGWSRCPPVALMRLVVSVKVEFLGQRCVQVDAIAMLCQVPQNLVRHDWQEVRKGLEHVDCH